MFDIDEIDANSGTGFSTECENWPLGITIEERRELIDDIFDLRVEKDDLTRQKLIETDPVERMRFDLQLRENQIKMNEKLEAYYADTLEHADNVIKDAEELIARI